MKKLTVKEVNARVAEIAAKKHDPERAHAMEDRLYTSVLSAISAGADNAAELAAASLKASKIDFARWCA